MASWSPSCLLTNVFSSYFCNVLLLVWLAAATTGHALSLPAAYLPEKEPEKLVAYENDKKIPTLLALALCLALAAEAKPFDGNFGVLYFIYPTGINKRKALYQVREE